MAAYKGGGGRLGVAKRKHKRAGSNIMIARTRPLSVGSPQPRGASLGFSEPVPCDTCHSLCLESQRSRSPAALCAPARCQSRRGSLAGPWPQWRFRPSCWSRGGAVCCAGFGSFVVKLRDLMESRMSSCARASALGLMFLWILITLLYKNLPFRPRSVQIISLGPTPLYCRYRQ